MMSDDLFAFEKYVVPRARRIVDRRLVTPFDGRKGVEYECPECQQPVVLRSASLNAQGLVEKAQHFAHLSETACSGGKGEGSRHRLAKELVAQTMRDWMDGSRAAPVFQFECRGCGAMQPFTMSKVDQVETEYGLRDHVVDVFVRQGVKEGAIEVCDTHPIPGEKVLALSGPSGIAWWFEIDAARVLQGQMRVRRASWTPKCRQPDCPGAISDEERALMDVRRQLTALPLVTRLADVCPGCGQHMILDEVMRLQFFTRGGSVTCRDCGINKGHDVTAETTMGA